MTVSPKDEVLVFYNDTPNHVTVTSGILKENHDDHIILIKNDKEITILKDKIVRIERERDGNGKM